MGMMMREPFLGISEFFSVKLRLFSYPSAYTSVLGAQKNRLIETVLLSTHNICFGREKKFSYTLLSGGPDTYEKGPSNVLAHSYNKKSLIWSLM